MLEMCAGRHQQRDQLTLMWDQMTIASAIREEGQDDSDEWLVGFWSRFIEGFVATSSSSVTV